VEKICKEKCRRIYEEMLISLFTNSCRVVCYEYDPVVAMETVQVALDPYRAF